MRRRGATLAELLVALTILGVIGSLWMRNLLVNERAVRTHHAGERAATTADEVVRILAASAGQVALDEPLRVLGDTALEWAMPVGAGISCAAFADSVTVPLAHPAVWWDIAPDSADRLVLESRSGERSEHVVVEVRQRASTPQCPAAARQLRFVPAASLPGAAGVLVRVTRQMRLVVYRGGDGLWWWGERRCGAVAGSGCGPAQPITGPLPSSRGSLMLSSGGPTVRAAARVQSELRRMAITRLP